MREIVRAYPGYVTTSQIASALNYPDEAWLPYDNHKTSRSPIAHHRVHAVVGKIRWKFGKEVIEADRAATHGKTSFGYRLSPRGRELLGTGFREVG